MLQHREVLQFSNSLNKNEPELELRAEQHQGRIKEEISLLPNIVPGLRLKEGLGQEEGSQVIAGLSEKLNQKILMTI